MTAHATELQRLANWIAAVSYEDLPQRVLQRARWQLMSVVAAVHAGAGTEAGAAVRAAVARRPRSGPCTVLPHNEKRPLEDALLQSSAYSMVLDYDDYLLMGHTGHSAVLGAWALCEAEDLTTRELILSQVIANEIEGRLGASCVLGPQNGQAWSFIHAAGGAALASRLLGLSRGQTAHALAVALYQPPYTLWPGFMGPTSKALTAALPTIAGIRAAQLAREGLTGALDIIEHPRHGFWQHFAFVPLPGMLAGLGRVWVTDTIAVKQYPGCAYLDTTLDALLEVLRRYREAAGRSLRPDEVGQVEVEAGLLTVGMDNLSAEAARHGELAPVAINFSIPLSAAIAILAGRLTAAELSADFLEQNANAIRSLASRITLAHAWPMTFDTVQCFDAAFGGRSPLPGLGPLDALRLALGLAPHLGGARRNDPRFGALLLEHPGRLLKLAQRLVRRGPAATLADADLARFRMVFPARVTLELASGQRLSAQQDVPFGAPGQARMAETVERKVRWELKGTEVDRALELMGKLEEVRLDELTRAVCKRQRV